MLDVLHELAASIEDLQLERCFFVELVFEVVSYQRAGRRVWTSKLFVADAVTSEATRVSQRRSHGKQIRVAAQNLRRHLLDRSCIVKDPDAATVCGENQIVLTRMDEDIVDRDVRKILQIQRYPFFAAAVRSKQAELRSRVDQISLLRLFTNYLHVRFRGQISGNVRP